MPYFALERRAAGFHRQSVDCLNFTRKISADGVSQSISAASAFKLESVFAIMQMQQPLHACFVITPIGGTQISILIRDEHHLANGRPDSLGKKSQDITHALLLLATTTA